MIAITFCGLALVDYCELSWGITRTNAKLAALMLAIESILIGIYFLFILTIGWWAGRDVKSGDDMHLGGRQTPWLAALISVVATEISAATLLGAPEAAFNGALLYVQLMLGSLVGRYIVAYFFVPAYYKAAVVTVYEFLERRLGAVSRKLTAILFLLNRMIADSVRLFMAAFTLEIIFSWSIEAAIALILCTTLLYVMRGGIKAVIWADVLQGSVFAGGGIVILLSLIWQLKQKGHSLGSLWTDLGLNGKLELVHFGSLQDTLTNPYSFVAAFVGGIVLTMATHGTDHDMIQRVLTCRSSQQGSRSLLGSGWVALGVGLLFLLVGSALWLSSLHGEFVAKSGTSPILTYLADYASPFTRGVMTAAILAAAMGSLGSSLAATTSTFANDLLPRGWSDSLRVTRLVMGCIACTVGGLGVATSYYHQAHPEVDLLQLALGALTLVSGTLLAFFVTALFCPARPGPGRCILAALAGVVTGVLLFLASDLAFEWRVVGGLGVTLGVLNIGAKTD